MNMWKYYVHTNVIGKMIPIETIPGMGEGHKREWWRE
jgi:hypothetical protein